MSEPFVDPSDEELGRRLAAELPRHRAPARLRAAIVEATTPPPVRAWWLAPALAAAATALAMMLVVIPMLPRGEAPDPVQRLVRAVVSEHTRVVLWGMRAEEAVPATTSWLSQETGINLSSMFVGDEHLVFIVAEPVYLDERRGVALHYRDSEGHAVTYIVLHAPGLGVPERRRVKVDRYRPALLRDAGLSLWVWKQGDLACFIVSDMVAESDLGQFKDYFVRVRQGTEPVLAR